MIYHIIIEPLEERYSAQWLRWFSKELGEDFRKIEGEGENYKIETGFVLDAYGTNIYKAQQLIHILEFIRAGDFTADDTLLFHDAWFPGLEAIQYVRDITKQKFKLVGILHAGTWDRYDFTYLSGMRRWARNIERGWLKFLDGIVVATDFHKNLILASNHGLKTPFLVVPLPFEADEVKRTQTKENIVVFPHRLDKEKRPEMFRKAAKNLAKKYPHWNFLLTKEQTNTKEDYYQLLGRSRVAVSCARQETYGYAMLEAIANGCLPVVPEGLSYGTMKQYENAPRFKTQKELEAGIEIQINNAELGASSFIVGDYSTKNFIKEVNSFVAGL